MKIKPFSLIEDEENDNENSIQTHFSSRMKKAASSGGDNINNSKKSLNSGNTSQNVNTAKKETQMKDLGINNQQKIVNDFREKATKEKLFENLNSLNNLMMKNRTIGQNQNYSINENNMPSITKEIRDQQDINNINKNEDVKENKLSKNLLNEKKDKKNSYYGKLYFVIAITMLLYQYFSYIFLIELPIIRGKYMKLIIIIFYKLYRKQNEYFIYDENNNISCSFCFVGNFIIFDIKNKSWDNTCILGVPHRR